MDQDGHEEIYVDGKLANLHFSNGDENATTLAALFKTSNTNTSLFNKVSKAGGKGMKVVSYQDSIVNGDSVLIITGKSSDKNSGVPYPTIEEAGTNQDLVDKPDKNDYWVFNPKNRSIVIDNSGTEVRVPSYTIKLVDVTGTAETDYSGISVSETNGTVITISNSGL